jgi:hypothetical protein
MKTAVIVFPGSNCDRDAHDALLKVTGKAPAMVWHKDGTIPEGTDFVMVPGGFSYGDYLRCGAMAGNSPVISQLIAHAARGGYVSGRLQRLPDPVRDRPASWRAHAQRIAALRLQTPAAHSRDVQHGLHQRVSKGRGEVVIPIAHHDGNYYADDATLDRIEGEGHVAFRYAAGEQPEWVSPRYRRHSQPEWARPGPHATSRSGPLAAMKAVTTVIGLFESLLSAA